MSKKINMASKISSKELADILGITVSSIVRMEKSNKLPCKPICINHTWYFEKEKIMSWLTTTPPTIKQRNKESKNTPFVYKEDQLQIILFCQPALLNRMSY